ncbi:MAG: hypothetical protein IKE46_11365 [Selenomonadaceae bacterium]|nr:hypothetical protein [Selenomonadaceae bacterium]
MTAVKKFFAVLALLLLTSSICAAESNFDILAAGHVDGEKQALMLIRNKTDGEIFFMPFDAEAETGAFVKFDRKIYDFYLNKGEYGYSPLMFVMATTPQNDKSDDALGEWKDGIHVIPVYALFDVKDGKIICESFSSGEKTIKPSHYHAPIKNPIHNKLIETLLTKMPLLHSDVEAKGIVLP